VSPGGPGFVAATQPTFGTTVQASAPPPPISGGTLLALSDGNTAVAADPDRNVLYVVNVAGGAVKHTIALQPGDEPGRLVEDGAGRVHAALRSGGALVTIDPVAGAVVGRRPVCPAPRGVAWDKASDLIWVACATGELVALPSAGGAPAVTRVMERDLRDVLIRNGTIDITRFRSAELLRVRGGTTASIVSRSPVTPPELSVSRQPHVLWRAVEGPSQSVVAVHQEHSTDPLPTKFPGAYDGFGNDPDAGPVTSRCTVIGEDGGVQSSVSLGAVLPVDVAVSPDGSFAVVVSPADAFSPGAPVLVLVDLSPDEILDGGFRSHIGPAPEGLTALPDGGFAPPTPNFGFFDAGGAVSIIPPSVGTADAAVMTAPSPVPFGGADAAAPAPASQSGPLSGTGQPVAVAFDRSGHLLVQTREPAKLWVINMPSSTSVSGMRPLPTGPFGRTEIVLSTISRADTGHDIFHATAGAMIACATCHPEGGDDGHVWMLDGLPRRTPSLRGTIAGTAPYHWPGDEKDLLALTQDVYVGRMKGPKLDGLQMSALTSWLEAIPAPAAPSWVDAAAAARGRAIFQRADTACSTCHSGPKLTNNRTVDVGTGAPFQVAPLVGVGWRAPFLHNGRAQTLRDRFAGCATTGHGSISQLAQQDVSDLIAYLETL
jgi:cytochrome c553